MRLQKSGLWLALALAACGGGGGGDDDGGDDGDGDDGMAMPDAAVVVDAAPPADAGADCETVEGFFNGNFEQGASAWTETSDYPQNLIGEEQTFNFASDTPPFLVRLGGLISPFGGGIGATDLVEQNFTVPPQSRDLVFRFRYQILTEEPADAPATDTFQAVIFVQPPDGPLDRVVTVELSNQDITNGYTDMELTIDGDFSGFLVGGATALTNDDENPTTALVDTASFTFTQCK